MATDDSASDSPVKLLYGLAAPGETRPLGPETLPQPSRRRPLFHSRWSAAAGENSYVDPQKLNFEIPKKSDGAAQDVDLGQDLSEARNASRVQWIGWVRPYGRWDYKQMSHYVYEAGKLVWYDYEEFGNFAFGFTGRANGWSKQQLLAGAGAVQIAWDQLQRASGHRVNPADRGWPVPGGSPYGDDPRDQVMAALGADFYDTYTSLPSITDVVPALSI